MGELLIGFEKVAMEHLDGPERLHAIPFADGGHPCEHVRGHPVAEHEGRIVLPELELRGRTLVNA
jgi:hypothetical protein